VSTDIDLTSPATHERVREQTRRRLGDAYAEQVVAWVRFLRVQGCRAGDVRAMLRCAMLARAARGPEVIALVMSAFVELDPARRTPGLELPEARP
jgi:hypothetical protein